jgi:hypothetical protein
MANENINLSFIHRPVADITALKAIDTASIASGVIANVGALGTWQFVKASAQAADDITVVQPTTGGGRWIKQSIINSAGAVQLPKDMDANGKKITGLANGVNPSDAATVAQITGGDSLWEISGSNAQLIDVTKKVYGDFLFKNDADANGKKLTNLAAGVNPTDAATVSQIVSGGITLSAVGTTPNANAATLTGAALNLEPANATYPGVVTTGSQTFGGNKTGQFTFNADANAGGFKITNLSPGVNPTDAATVSQISGGGGGEKDYDATVGVGGDYATIQLALNASKYKILILDNYTETADITIPSQATYYFYAKKSVNLSTYNILLYASNSNSNIIYFSGNFVSTGLLLKGQIPGVTYRVALHWLPGSVLDQSAAANDTSGIIYPSDPSTIFVNQTFYPGSSYLLPENDLTSVISAGNNTLTIFNNSKITFPSGKNFGSFHSGSHAVHIIGGLTCYGSPSALSPTKILFNVKKLNGILDFRNVSVYTGALLNINVTQTAFGSGSGNDDFGQILGPVNVTPISATAYSYTNTSLNLAEQPAISDTSQVGNDSPRSIYVALDKSGTQISNLSAHVLTINGSNNNISSYRAVASIPVGAIIDKTSPKEWTTPYGAGGVTITNPGSGIPGSISFAPTGGAGTGSWFTAEVVGGQIVRFVSFGNPAFNSGFRYGSYITGSGYNIGDVLNDATYGIQLQVVNVYDGNAITITGSGNTVRVTSALDGIKITGDNNIVYVPGSWAGTRTVSGTGNRIIVGTKDLAIYSITTASVPNVFVDTDGSLKRSTAPTSINYAFESTLLTSQVDVTGDGAWVKVAFDNEVSDPRGIYNPVNAQFVAPFDCIVNVGANIIITNAIVFPSASDYNLKFVRRNSIGSAIGETMCRVKKCTSSTSNEYDYIIYDNVSCSFSCATGDTVELQMRVNFIGLKTVSIYPSSSNQKFWGEIVAVI